MSLLPSRKGQKEDPGKYRLVSLSWIPAKVMEQMILETTSKHRKDEKVTVYSEHGFMKGKTLLLNLVAFCNEVSSSVDKGRAVDVVYLNSENAFDAVCRNITTDK